MDNNYISHSQDMWTIKENQFNDAWLGKGEVIMALGNGYMGIRSTNEENYFGEVRNTFIAGSFNKAYNNEVTELPNVPDMIQMDITINGQKLNLMEGTIHSYSKTLNLKTGELRREVVWETEKTGKLILLFRRLVSMDNLHLIAQTVEITPNNKDVELQILSGIDGQVSNSGAQHFIEGEKRLFDNEIMTMVQETSESAIKLLQATVHKSYIDGKEVNNDLLILMDRRKIFGKMTGLLSVGQTYTINKYSAICMDRDLGFEDLTLDQHRDRIISIIEEVKLLAFDELLERSAKVWMDKVWSKITITIESKEGFDLTALRFAQYHLQIMTPIHDKRMGIGAKGLTGEGYKGHSFWDTEVFMFPYFLYTQPKVARQLLEYRYLTLPGAREKAKVNGYEGAMFPWESAWLSDGEVTPVWGAADIISGKAIKIWSGFIEQHITADIAFALFQYYSVTRDEEFMDNFGYELLFDAAIFWVSRLEDGADGKLHINNVIGPDEYKEHIDDNAFTNYLAHMNLELSIKYAKELIDRNDDIFTRLDNQFDLENEIKLWENAKEKMYLPITNEESIIPQDSSYLSKKQIDLSKYKNQEHVGSIFADYNLEQVNDIQVSKQADIMMLFYLREDLFGKEVKKANWDYYEPKTLHDSSLSLSTHAIIANDIGDYDLSYDLFTKCRKIDLGQNMKSSDHGIHAASLGGMIQVIMNGFGGIRVLNGTLRIEPHLPKKWQRLQFPFNWHGDELRITVTQQTVTVENMTGSNETIEFQAFGASYLLSEKTTFQLS